MKTGQQLVLQVPNDRDYLETLTHAAKFFAERLGFDSEDSGMIQLAVEEGALNILQHAYAPGEDSSYRLTLEAMSDGMKITFHDDGLPFALAASTPPPAASEAANPEDKLGFRLMRGAMDTLDFVNLGPKGKELTLEKFFKKGSVADSMTPEEAAELRQDRPADNIIRVDPQDVEVRLLNPDDLKEALEVCRCVYLTYGYTYGHGNVYFPEKLAEMNREGTFVSVIGINKRTGDLMGHAALKLKNFGDKTAENGAAFVKPLYRGQGILGQLVAYRLAEAKRRGIETIYTQTVTAHPASQKASLSAGFKEIGLNVGNSGVYNWKNFSLEKKNFRTSMLVLVNHLTPRQRAIFYPPAEHRDILSDIFAHVGIEAALLEAPTDLRPNLDISRISSSCNLVNHAGALQFDHIGTNAVEALRRSLRVMSEQGMLHINLFLPLGSPFTPWLCSEAYKYDFFFAGAGINERAEDVLHLQKNTVGVDYDSIKLVTEFGAKLLAYVKAQDPGKA